LKNLIERLSIRSGLTKLEVSALLFVLVAIVTGALIQILKPDAKAEIPPHKEKTSAQLLKEQTEKVEKEKQKKSGSKSSVSSSAEIEIPKDSSININSASKEDFTRIPGVSDKLAKAIVDEREKLNRELGRGFDSIEELEIVKGIGKVKLNAIKRYLTL